MNVNLSRRRKNGNSAQPTMRNVTDQDEINANSPKTHQYGRIPTKDIVFQPKRARVLLPTRGKSIEHVQSITHGPKECLYANGRYRTNEAINKKKTY